MLLTNVVTLIQDEAAEALQLTSANNGVIGGFLYVVATMAIIIFIGSFVSSSKD